jgi:hypothetical protein
MSDTPPDNPQTDGEQSRSSDTDSETALQVQGEPRPRPWWAAWLHYTVTTLLVAATLIIGGWAAWMTTAETTSRKHSRTETDASVTRQLADAHLRAAQQRLRLALDIYALRERNYPGSMRAVVSRGLLASSDLYYASGRPRFNYIVERDQFRLEPIRRWSSTDGSAN